MDLDFRIHAGSGQLKHPSVVRARCLGLTIGFSAGMLKPLESSAPAESEIRAGSLMPGRNAGTRIWYSMANTIGWVGSETQH